jgi:hypothetical protein
MVKGITEGRCELNGTLQPGGQVHIQGLSAPDHDHTVVQDNAETKTGQDLVEVRFGVEVLDQDPFNDPRKHKHHAHGKQNGQAK